MVLQCAILSSSLQGMFTSTTFSRAARLKSSRMGVARISPFANGMQKRTFYTPELLKQWSELPKELSIFSPAYGIAKKESGALEKMYAVESDASAIKLVQSLFHQIGNQFLPTKHISNPVCALNPAILGLIIAAGEKNQLENPQVRSYIAHEWRVEYEKVAADTKRADGKARSAKDVSKLMNEVDNKIDKQLALINKEYAHDKNSGRSILQSFFALKADLTSDHDMIHYLSGINACLRVIENKKKENEGAPTSAGNESDVPSVTLMDRLKLFVQTIKDRVIGSGVKVPVSSDPKNYTQQDYAAFKAKAKEVEPRQIVEFALENFELALSAILNEKRNTSFYPPLVVRSTYGYDGQHARPNCIETAFQDLFNILLYNSKTKQFDVSYLPGGLPLNESFKKFYQDYNPSQSNGKQVGQAFMDMVSNINGVDYYAGKNYELNSNPDNFLKIANHFLGAAAQNLAELGAALSDERRTVTFTQHDPHKGGFAKINMLIKDNQNNTQLSAGLGFLPGHGEISVPERTGSKKSLLDPSILAEKYTMNPQMQALSSIQALFTSIEENKPASFYYALNADGDWNKVSIIRGILENKKVTQESVDYIKHLYKTLDFSPAIDVVTAIVISGALKNFPELKSILVDMKDAIISKNDSADNEFNRIQIINAFLPNMGRFDTVDDILLYQEIVNYSFSLYQQLSYYGQKDLIFKMMIAVLTSDMWLFNPEMKNFVIKNIESAIEYAIRRDIFDVDLAMKLYENSNAISKPKYLTYILNVINDWSRKYDSEELVAIAKKLIDLGVDVNAVSERGKTPLYLAVDIENPQLVELLIANGAIVDVINKISHDGNRDVIVQQAALFLAARRGNDAIIDILLRNGANPNLEGDVNESVKSTPLAEAVFSRGNVVSNTYASTKLLLEHGANLSVPVRSNIFVLPWVITGFDKKYEPEKLVDLLIHYGVDVNRIDENGNAALDMAYIRKSRPNEGKEADKIIQSLVRAGAKRGADLMQEDEQNKRLVTE